MDAANKPFGWIYLHRNKVNEKVYVGQSAGQPEKRWNSGSGYNSKNKCGTPFSNAIKKYGWDGFDHIIVCECYSREELDSEEVAFISLFHSNERTFGYNLAPGGRGSSGYKVSEETKQKIREARPRQAPLSEEGRRRIQIASSKRRHTEEEKQKIRVANIGRVFTVEAKEKMRQARLGKKLSDATIKKLREINTGRKHTEEAKEKNRKIAFMRWENWRKNKLAPNHNEASSFSDLFE